MAENVLSFLDARSLCAAELVSKEWLRVISEVGMYNCTFSFKSLQCRACTFNFTFIAMFVVLPNVDCRACCGRN